MMKHTAGCLLALLLFANAGDAAPQSKRSGAANGQATTVARWTRFEARLMSSAVYENPAQDVEVAVTFSSPSKRTQTVLAFWDGNKTWRVRFSPDEVGRWTYRTRSSKASDDGLNDQRGEFVCVPYAGVNPLYRHGAIRRAENRRYFVHADGTPFFWLGDTAWNGPLKASAKDWDAYLRDRAGKDFNVIKFVTTQWNAATGDADNRVAYTNRERIAINPEFYQRMDERVAAINDHGLVAAPVLLWAHPSQPQLNPGIALSAEQMIVLAKYMVARYGAHQVVWMLNGDGEYRGEKSELWKRVGRAVFAAGHPDRLATLHPGQGRWMTDDFGAEPWFSFNGYQSGHRDDEKNLRWLIEGPPSQSWRRMVPVPDINLEPSYEAHNSRSQNSKHVFDARDIRRAAYWSVLVAPPAGVSYGAHGVWSWETEAGEPLNHKGTGVAQPWSKAMKLPGSLHMKYLKNLFSSLRWWTLRPAQDLLAEQPGSRSAPAFIAAARSERGDVAVIYIPVGGTVSVRMERFNSPVTAEWFDPATGERTAGEMVRNQDAHLFRNSGDRDWVLLLSEAPRKRLRKNR